MLNFERFTKVRFYILFPELSNSACLPGIAGGLPRLIMAWVGGKGKGGMANSEWRVVDRDTRIS